MTLQPYYWRLGIQAKFFCGKLEVEFFWHLQSLLLKNSSDGIYHTGGISLFHLEQWFININPMSKMPVQDFGSKMADQKLPTCDSMHERVIKTTKSILRKEGEVMGNQESWQNTWRAAQGHSKDDVEQWGKALALLGSGSQGHTFMISQVSGQSTYHLEKQWETLVRHWFFLHLVSNGKFWFHKSQGSTYSHQRVYRLRIIYIKSFLLPPAGMQFNSISREACLILCFLLFKFFPFLFSCCLQ